MVRKKEKKIMKEITKNRTADGQHGLSAMARRGMLIPLACLGAFSLVGFASADSKPPVIRTSILEVPYGMKFSTDAVEVTDDSSLPLDVKADTSSLDTRQLGTYSIKVTAADAFKNTAEKTIQVDVVDREAPVFTSRYMDGYVISVKANGSSNPADYIKAKDNADGDVSDFITFSGQIDTTKPGIQEVTAEVDDTSGNRTRKTFQFNVMDDEAPVLNQKADKVDYGGSANLSDYFEASDNLPGVQLSSDVPLDTKKEGIQHLKVTATDSSGNKTVKEADITVTDMSAPVIALTADSVRIPAGASFDPASYIASAVDSKDGDVKQTVAVSSNVNTSAEGHYSVTYTAKDKAGNISSKSMAVEVFDVEAEKGRNMAATANTKIGSAYVFGASGYDGVYDCSSFAQFVYRSQGKSLPRTAEAQFNATRRVTDLRPGDLVFFQGTYKSGISHVGIYIGNNMFTHAANARKGVITSSLSDSYYGAHYAGAGRL